MRREITEHGTETLEADKLTFEKLAEKYKETKLIKAQYSNGVKVSGRRSLGSAKSQLKALLSYFGDKKIRLIKVSDLEKYKHKRLNTPTSRGTFLKIATVNRELELLRAMLNFAIQNEWLIRNPFLLAKGLISKAAEVERDRVFSFDEEERLLTACVGRRAHLRPLIICALDTAMRRGEIFKMVWNDVNFVSGEIHIPQTNAKTEKSRTVGMTPRLIAELQKLWNQSPKDKSELVLGLTHSVKTSWKTACQMASIVNFRLHDCRHTATTRMIASGSPHTEVMKITGHSQLKTFLRYLNITPETARGVASRLNEYLAKKKVGVDTDISKLVN
ncbi:MAG: site-specific integrase [Pyrinomonadaceae bacterium]|nr:site-specific integrase [Pyrinomonadaceae bacterium]